MFVTARAFPLEIKPFNEVTSAHSDGRATGKQLISRCLLCKRQIPFEKCTDGSASGILGKW